MNEVDISIVIPIYFNQGSIFKTYEKIRDEIFPAFPGLAFEIVMVDDGSKDESYSEMLRAKEADPRVSLVRFTRNFGQVPAIYAGYAKARGRGVVNIAADLQEPAELLVQIIRSFLDGQAPVVAGRRVSRDESLYRKRSSQLFYRLMRRLSFPEMPDGGFDIVLVDQAVKQRLIESSESNPFWQGQILWLGYPVKYIPYHRLRREVGKSRWTFGKKLKYLLDGVLNYSYAPLRLFSAIGIASFGLGLLYSLVIVVSYFMGKSPFEGWAPIMIVVLLFSGLQLMLMGLIGEYIWRILDQVKARPRYVIRDES